MVSDETFKLILILILIVLGLTLGLFILGPILAAWVLVRGWINTSWLAKVGAIVFPLMGIAASLDMFTFGGDQGISNDLMSLLLAAWMVAIQPLLTYILLGIAFSRRHDLM